MCDVPVFYATIDGQTRRIAECVASTLREEGLTSQLIEIGSEDAERFDWTRARAVFVGAPLHHGRHPKAAAAFVHRHVETLNARPCAFFSVSLGCGFGTAPEVEAARAQARSFMKDANWRPDLHACFGGILAYRRYGVFKRMMMRRMSRKAGGPTDTTRNHDFTDWNDVRALARDMASMMQPDMLRRRAG
jgi:menaquinone-dependent protoporphyrinogen oxidase